jgi:hypothetical protein
MSNPFRYFNSSPEVIRLVVMMCVMSIPLCQQILDIARKTGQGCGAEVSDADHEDIRLAAKDRHRRALLLFCDDERDRRRGSSRGRRSAQQSSGEFASTVRRREWAMQRFRSTTTLQKFSSVHAQVHNHFNQERHLVTQHSLLQGRALISGFSSTLVSRNDAAFMLSADVAG